MRTMNPDDYSDWEAYWLDHWFEMEYGYEPEETIEEDDTDPDLYDQYEYMLDHQDND